MKTTNHFKRILSAGFLLLLILLIVTSCKKKDDTPDPVPPIPPAPVVNDVFLNRPLHMMSEYEIENNIQFPGHILNQLGNGMVGGEGPSAFNIFKKVGKTLWEVHDYKHTEMRFDEIEDGISQIQGQIAQLQKEITDMGLQLSLDVSELEQFISSGVMNTYITNITGVMDSTSHTGFAYFPMEARRYQAGQITEQQMKTDTGYASTFAANVFNKQSAYNVCNWSEQLNALICPPTGGSQSNALKSYANVLIQKVNHLNPSDTATIMKCYKLFENYFLQVINNQFQCVMVWSNACNYYDTTGYQANLYYTGTFQQNIKQEVAAYLSTVEYLAVNLNDYRHAVKMQGDFPYAVNGLAPEFLFMHILGRAQFISNLIYDGLGLPYPVMSGTVITPSKYSNELGTNVDSIAFTVNGKQLTSTANVLASQFPYTYWSIGYPATCYPDNGWNVYRFGKMGVTDPGWANGPLPVSLVDNGSTNAPWTHFQPVAGKVTALFYNPQDTRQTSPTATSVCTMQFGHFSARWNWGYCFITMTIPYSSYPNPYDVGQENPDNAYGCENQATPCMGVIAPHKAVSYQSTSGFSLPYHNMAYMSFAGSVTKSEYYTFVADLLYATIETSSVKPPISGGIGMWAASQLNYNLGGVSKSFTRGYAGSDLKKNTYTICKGYDYYCSTADIIKTTISNNGYGSIECSSVNINTGIQTKPTAGYYFQTYNCGNMYLEVNYAAMMQVVYSGTYNIFQ